MYNEYDADRDPMKSMNILQAIRRAVAAWNDDVTPTTIGDCWIQAGVLESKYSPGVTGWKNLVNSDTKIFNDTINQMEQQIASLMR